MNTLYDAIGVDYAQLRKPDPRIAEQIHAALDDAQSVLNIGAGAGSYEPIDRDVVAIEPSAEMIAQRPAGAARAVQGSAESLPFEDGSFDAALAILTIHHWSDQARGLAEMRRVARKRAVLLTFDPAFRDAWQLYYWPQLATLDDEQMPLLRFYEQHLGPVRIEEVAIPHDCSDGFLYAYWRRPSAYLDERIRKGSSSFWRIDGLDEGAARLEADLASGAWEERYGHLLAQENADMGYRLVIAEFD
ncbi:class I SAM-dependent methyltransferase [Altererythrobacter sp. MF3-039]|uniref:class I SAM-dependent methyltransferase n=1 Tax=Altererythrobacter sp. MF3-039 TaxID=3252901 RepID=UPI00390CD7F2